MQDKMMAGFNEARRILKPDGHAVYNMSLVDDHNSGNTKKWIELHLSLPDTYGVERNGMRDIIEWLNECQRAGFAENRYIKIRGEMPAPDTDTFPFENQILRWMANYVFVSRK
jgi:hypothetical protein